MRLLLLIAIALTLAPVTGGGTAWAATEIRLAPREPLIAEALVAFLEGQLPAQPAGQRLVPTIASPRLPLANPSERAVSIRSAGLDVDEATQRLSARLLVEVEGGATNLLEVKGRVQAMLEVPVLRRVVESGARIDEAELELAWLPAAHVRAGTVVDVVGLAGREAARRLPAGRPIRVSDVRVPRLVHKGETVTILFTSDGLELMAQGRALEEGGAGEAVRVLNVDSSRQVEGVVLGPRRVGVSLGAERRP